MGAFLMANTYNEHNGTGSQDTFAYTFPYLKTTDVKVSVDGVVKQLTTDYTRPSVTTIQFNSDKKPANGTKVRIYRDTDESSANATFYAGSAIKSQDLNDTFLQAIYIGEEGKETADDAWNKLEDSVDSTETWVSNNTKVGTTGAIDARINTELTSGSKNFSTSGTLTAGATTVTGNITVSGTVDGRDVAADGTKLDGIESGATADQTNAEIRAAVEAATDSNVFTDADHSKLNAIEASATADQTNAEIRAAIEAASDSNVFTDADHTKLNAIEANATADQTVSEIKSLIASSPLDASHLAANSVTTSELADAELTTLAGMQSGTASILASGTALTSTTAELNLLDGKSVVTAVSGSSNDNQLPTAKAVNDQILAITAEAGGFVPIANEVSFPNTNPDTEDNAGTIVSIADAGGIVVNGSGVSTTGRTLGGATVTINGIDSSLYNTTIAAGKGMLVQTTSSLNTYDYHRLIVDEAGVAAAQTLVSDFNNRYRIASSAPSSSLDDGDLWFDTTNNKMKVYNASGTSWDDVASSGDFYINTLSSSGNTGGGSATFNGTAYRFVLSNPPTAAQQLIVSVNGVIQKPNSGTSQPSEGFAISGNDIIFAAAPATSSDYFIVTIGNTVSIGTPSDNTVSTAKIQNLAVTGDKVATNLDLADNKKIRFGTGNDLEIYHNSTGNLSTIYNSNATGLAARSNVIMLQNSAGDHDYLTTANEAGVSLYYDNARKLETFASGVQFDDNIVIKDSKKALFGDGWDLQIYHDGSDSYIKHNGTGNLYVQTSEASVEDLFLQAGNDVWIRVQTGETAIKAIGDGAVELYYDNSKKFETTSVGGLLTGKLEASNGFWCKDNVTYRCGDGTDLMIYHDATDNHITSSNGNINIEVAEGDDVKITAGGENVIWGHGNGEVNLYYNNVKKFETTSGGAAVTGSFVADSFTFTGDTDTVIDNSAANTIQFKTNGVERLLINNFGTHIGANLYSNGKNFALGDSSGSTDDRITIGDSQDLQLYHDGLQSYIKETGTGNLYISASSKVQIDAANDETMAAFFEDGAVVLNWDGSTKLETASTGIGITGKLFFDGDGGAHIENTGNNELTVKTDSTVCTVFAANQRVKMPTVYSTNGSSMNDVQIESDGTLCAGNTSIRASKKNIVSQTDVSWLYDLNPVTFNYRKKLVHPTTGEHTYLEEAESETAYGLIAEEVETVNKDFCFYNDDKLAGVYYKQLITPLLKALQDQKKEIDTLKTKVAALEAK